MKKSLFLFLALIIVSLSDLSAQKTGSFNDTLQFADESRIISCFVPTNYSPDTKYNILIGLHGLGDNSTNYRNAIIGTIRWQNLLPNTIFVFPDGGNDQSRDFLSPEGDELFIDAALAHIASNYNVDLDSIILQGFSLGGRAALKLGLDNPEKYKGMLLNTPAIQGYHDLNNSEFFNYANADKIRTVVIWGEDDITYRITCDSLYSRLVHNNGIAIGGGIPNMGHSLPPNQINSHLFGFLNNPLRPEISIQIYQVVGPYHTCNGKISPNIKFRNLSNDIIESITFDAYNSEDELVGKYTWNGEAAPYELVRFNIGEVDIEGFGDYGLYFYISNINGEEIELEEVDGEFLGVVVQGFGLPTPYTENFDDYDELVHYWRINSSGNNYSWMPSISLGEIENSLAMFNTILLFDNTGVGEDLVSLPIDLTTAEEPTMFLDVAFSYHKWGEPYFTQTFTLSDTLEILISYDCGNSYTSLFKKFGNDLLTLSAPIENPVQLTDGFFKPSKEDWKTLELSLNEYKDVETAMFKIRYISGLGGTIYIDNFTVANKGFISVKDLSINATVFPNPANSFIKITSEEPINEVNIYDLSGRKLYNSANLSGSTEMRIETNEFQTGMYVLELRSGNKISLQKILISRSK